MSFGFSVGDFIAVAQLAYSIYDRCRTAGDTCETLARSLRLLEGNLQNVVTFMQRERYGTPGMRDAFGSLDMARQACEKTLNDIKSWLDKYADPQAKKSLRVIGAMMFIRGDLDAFQRRVDGCAANLQGCLLPLANLSLLDLRDKIDQILRERRVGKDDRSVLSLALTGKSVKRDDALGELRDDLLGKSVHPEALDVHEWQVRKMLFEAIDGSGQRRSGSNVDADNLLDGMYLVHKVNSTWDAVPRFPQAALGDQQQWQPHAIKTSPAGSSAPNIPFNPRPSPIASNSEESSTMSTTVRDSDTSLGGTTLDETGVYEHLISATEAQSSRPSSAGSHLSKDSDWHPSQGPDLKWVIKMLRAVFARDPLRGLMPSEQATRYFKRAFHQQDYRGRRYLTKEEVFRTCRAAIDSTIAGLDDAAIRRAIQQGNTNKDGKIVLADYLDTMHDLVLDVTEKAREELEAHFQHDIAFADQAARARQLTPPYVVSSCTWGFRRNPITDATSSDSAVVFHDDVEDRDYTDPQRPLPLHSFTSMADEVASYGVRVIDEAEQHWLAALPDEYHAEFSQVFESVRQAALHFTMLENPTNPDLLSDLDAMLVPLYIVKREGDNFLPYMLHRKHVLETLQKHRRNCHRMASHIRGFVWRLEHLHYDPRLQALPASAPVPASVWPKPQTLTSDLASWNRARMQSWAWKITESPRAKRIWDGFEANIALLRDRSRLWTLYPGYSDEPSPETRFNREAVTAAAQYSRKVREKQAAEASRVEQQRRRFEICIEQLSYAGNRRLFSSRRSGRMPDVNITVTGTLNGVSTGTSIMERVGGRGSRDVFECYLAAHVTEAIVSIREAEPSRTPKRWEERFALPSEQVELRGFSDDFLDSVAANVSARWSVEARKIEETPDLESAPWLQLIENCYALRKGWTSSLE